MAAITGQFNALYRRFNLQQYRNRALDPGVWCWTGLGWLSQRHLPIVLGPFLTFLFTEICKFELSFPPENSCVCFHPGKKGFFSPCFGHFNACMHFAELRFLCCFFCQFRCFPLFTPKIFASVGKDVSLLLWEVYGNPKTQCCLRFSVNFIESLQINSIKLIKLGICPPEIGICPPEIGICQPKIRNHPPRIAVLVQLPPPTAGGGARPAVRPRQRRGGGRPGRPRAAAGPPPPGPRLHRRGGPRDTAMAPAPLPSEPNL